jgi:Concanavalin A-like lectin/glucanases superfamily
MVAPVTVGARLLSTGTLLTIGEYDEHTGTGGPSPHRISRTGVFADELDEVTLVTQPNSGGSIALNGTNQKISITGSSDFMFGTGDFTIEGWFYISSAPSAYTRLWCFPDGDNVEMTNGIMYYWNGGGSMISGGANTAPHGSWFHVALVKYNQVVNVYLNGTSIITDNSPYNSLSSRPLSIGAEVNADTYGQNPTPSVTDGWLQGNVTNFRIVKGYAVYTSNFHTAYSPLTVLPNTVLLLKASDSSHLITDSSGTGKSVTNVGTATFDALTPLNTYFNGAMKQLKTGELLLADELDEVLDTQPTPGVLA